MWSLTLFQQIIHSQTSQLIKRVILTFAEILLRLEQKFDSGQESILENQTQMLNRLTTLEAQIEKFKLETEVVKTRNSELEANFNSLSESVANNYDHGKAWFTYSRNLPATAAGTCATGCLRRYVHKHILLPVTMPVARHSLLNLCCCCCFQFFLAGSRSTAEIWCQL